MAEVKLNATVLSKVEIAPGLIVLRVRPEEQIKEFKPGQFTTLGLPGSAPRFEIADPEEEAPPPDKMIRRAYSISSASEKTDYLEFYITLIRSGSLTPRLFALKEGDPLFVAPKITGVFTLDEAPHESNLIMVATGTGLAPYMSMIRSIFSKQTHRKYAIIHGARHSWDLGYRAELETLAEYFPTFAYQPIISRPDKEHTPWNGPKGYVQDQWKSGAVGKKWGFKPDASNSCVFLCGAPAMVEDMLTILASEGFKEHKKKDPGNVFVERFW
ncbi:MAG: ferredoxin--NADP reductase [Nitrospinota bacterium]|nr:ferredoxin--NADP reductase [Nitrospinota bacterium]MDH5756924.1 ferredoxin--NADP reductase [Nitrospinota bacterium]